MNEYLWWQRGVIYQVYPRSFQDGNGDGVGDIPGITSRLDYLDRLGVDAVWISPIFPSPMADFGYDVSNYTDIDPVFGSMADLDALIETAHRGGMKVILDYVPNHTSDRHPWFLESRSSRDNPRRDWYIWRDPAPDGGPPNNWLAHFGGSAWTLDPSTGQYYYHAFLVEQPDLNWRNPEVREAMFDVLRFWLDRGVDGFRIDVLWQLIKDDQFRDNPPNPDYVPEQGPYKSLLPVYTADLPEMQEITAEMRRIIDSREGDRVMIGEIYLPVERLVAYYGKDGTGAHLPFNFQLLKLPWNAAVIKKAVDRYEALLTPGAWPNWVLGNHDKHRIASRIGRAQARVAAMMLLTLRGTPTMYYGDEIGMTDVPIPPDRVRDPFEKNVPGLGLGRDPERTPMQWNSQPAAGFTTGDPWLPPASDYAEVNVEAAQNDPASLLGLYRRLIELRRKEPALSTGDYASLDATGDVFAYLRRAGKRRFLVALNLGHCPQLLALPSVRGRIVLNTHLDRDGEAASEVLRLRENEGVILEIAP